MTDNTQEKGLTLTIPSLSDLIGSVWAKLIAILAAISLLLGIVLEVQSVFTGFEVLRKTAYEADIAEVNANWARTQGKYP